MKGKRVFIIFMIVVFSLSTLSSERVTHSTLKYEYEEYSEEEFPIWTNEIRRAESLFFGSYVFTIPIAGLALTSLRSLGVVSSSGTTEQNALLTLSVASGLSLFVATLDWVIGRIEQ